jgi:hypothetical protein
MLRILTNLRHQRTAHFRDGRFVRLYGPGRHLVWTLGGLHEFLPIDVNQVLQRVGPADNLPADLDGAVTFDVPRGTLRLVFLDGALHSVLDPGRYRQWSVGARVTTLEVDLNAPPEPLRDGDELPRGDRWQELVCDGTNILVLSRGGRPIRQLPPGRYRFWDGSPWDWTQLSLMLRSLEIAVQDLVSQDQVPVRVKPAATWKITDPMVYLREGNTDSIYLAVQLALREVVAGRPLEALLTEREALAKELTARARAHLPEIGVSLESAAIKDVILPGEVKDQFNKVTVARKEAEAMGIRRREEVAHTRQLANTAKLLADNPVLMRLKELEQLAELAERIDKLTVVGTPELLREVVGGMARGG